MKRINKKEIKREQAEDRQAARDILTPQQQLKKLDELLGVGVGAKKERTRLLKQIRNER